MAQDIKHMKWWGWGDPNKEFLIADKPGLWSYIEKKIGVKHELVSPPVSLDQIELPNAQMNHAFLAEIYNILDVGHIKTTRDRVMHTREIHDHERTLSIFREVEGFLKRLANAGISE